MTDQGLRACLSCGAPLVLGARFCRNCGTPTSDQPEEVALAGGARLRLASESLSLRELLAVVEAGVFYWRRRLESAEGVAREQAAVAINELSQILSSLATQIAQGREVVQITGRLPAQRAAPLPCPLCGRGNRKAANYCIACGTPLRPGLRPAVSPPPLRSLTLAARTDLGRARPLNEDTIYVGEFNSADGPLGTLLLVADGMGGHAAGDIASNLAAATLKASLTATLSLGVPSDDSAWQDLLRGAVTAANSAVYAQASRSPERNGMGTTLTAAVIIGRRAHLAHVGDSRAYLINAAGVAAEGLTWLQLTTDHSLVARLVDIGQISPAEARVHPQRNVIYRSLGSDPALEVDTASQALASGDMLLLCSDGLVTHVEDEELARLVLTSISADHACERLVELANTRGGKDNISVVIVRVK